MLLNTLCMAWAGSESEHGLFSVIIIPFANTQPLCSSGVRGRWYDKILRASEAAADAGCHV